MVSFENSVSSFEGDFTNFDADFSSKENIVGAFYKLGLFLDPDVCDVFELHDIKRLYEFCVKKLKIVKSSDLLIVTTSLFSVFLRSPSAFESLVSDLNWKEYELAVVNEQLNIDKKLIHNFDKVFHPEDSNLDKSADFDDSSGDDSINDNKNFSDDSENSESYSSLQKNADKSFSSSKVSEVSESDNGSESPQISVVKNEKSLVGNVDVLFSFEENDDKKCFSDFVSYFNSRYNKISKMLRMREKMVDSLPISRILTTDNSEVSVTGIISDINRGPNSVIVHLEDPTGTIKVIFSNGKKEVYEEAKDFVFDEVIGVRGALSKFKRGERVMYPIEVYHPDVPFSSKIITSPYDGYVVFLSDLHVGSTKFLGDDLDKFLRWIRGESADPRQRMIASSVRYVFVLGDLVDGVGVYPGQEKELVIKDIREQYLECARYLSKIPSYIPVVIIPGNHDAVRLEEPQPVLSKDYAKPLWDLPNVKMLTNPALVSIDSNANFSGIKVLLYHGYSFDYYVANVDSIRTNGGYDRADLIMRFLMQRRHLAPTHSSSVYVPDSRGDSMVIDTVPDIFATGHIHKTSVSTYKGITMLSGSCWQDRTSFQEKVGHHPEPSRVPIVNLKTREVTILNFGK